MKTLQQEIYKLISVNGNNVYSDFLPSKDENDIDLDYSKNLYITYSLKNIEDIGYKDSILLDVEVISSLENRLNVRDKALELDELLKDTYIEKCDSKIIRSNVYFMPFNDLEDSKALITLSYKILKY